mgnify:FL=1
MHVHLLVRATVAMLDHDYFFLRITTGHLYYYYLILMILFVLVVIAKLLLLKVVLIECGLMGAILLFIVIFLVTLLLVGNDILLIDRLPFDFDFFERGRELVHVVQARHFALIQTVCRY